MKPATKSRELHDALQAAKAAAAVSRVAAATGCTATEITGQDGQLSPLAMLDAMRARGYQVGEPYIPKTQTKPGHTAWKVSIAVKGVAAQLVFFIPGVAQ